MIAFLGSTIGNLEPEPVAAFLRDVRAALKPGDTFLLGADLVKDPARLVVAYDDAAGVTAEFNRNVLRVINAGLGADFDPDAFEHVALWDEQHERIEMRLRARRDLQVTIPALDLEVAFVGRRGDANRGVGEVPPRGTGGRAARRRAAAGRLVHRRPRAISGWCSPRPARPALPSSSVSRVPARDRGRDPRAVARPGSTGLLGLPAGWDRPPSSAPPAPTWRFLAVRSRAGTTWGWRVWTSARRARLRAADHPTGARRQNAGPVARCRECHVALSARTRHHARRDSRSAAIARVSSRSAGSFLTACASARIRS